MESIGNMPQEPRELQNTIVFNPDTRGCEEEHISAVLTAEQLAVDGVSIVQAFRVEVLAHQAAERKRMFDIGARNRPRPRTPIDPWEGK